MKALAILASCLMLLFPAMFLGLSVYALLTPLDVIAGEPDATGGSGEQLLQEPPNGWHRIANEQLFTEDDLTVIDGSTATVPITAELYRQFVDSTVGTAYSNRFVSHSTTHYAYLNRLGFSSSSPSRSYWPGRLQSTTR